MVEMCKQSYTNIFMCGEYMTKKVDKGLIDKSKNKAYTWRKNVIGVNL